MYRDKHGKITQSAMNLRVGHDAESDAVDLGEAVREEDVEPVVREVQRLQVLGREPLHALHAQAVPLGRLLREDPLAVERNLLRRDLGHEGQSAQ